MTDNYTDIYIKGQKDPNFDDSRVETGSYLELIVSKITMILMTNKGEVMGDPDFGADIPLYLWKTKFPQSTIKANIQNQFLKYIPELKANEYKIEVLIIPGNARDIGFISISLGISSVNAVFK